MNFIHIIGNNICKAQVPDMHNIQGSLTLLEDENNKNVMRAVD